MEAAGAPRLDAERRKLVRRSTRGAGQRGLPRRDNSMLCCLPMPSGWPRNEARAFGRPSGPARSGRWRIELSQESNMYASRWVANPWRRK
ncbi:unnamed protein product [Calypogeia fissa]